jgi:eukaryotic-like serine/threonine-protein kinase
VIAGKYRVEGVIGRGGVGTVYEATHLALGQRVALKLLRRVKASRDVVERFLLEAKIAAQLPHDHIVSVTDVGEAEGGEPYLVMELLTGHDLSAELARRGSFPIDEAVDCVLQAAEGLAEAHAAGLVHRDLKPANLFLHKRKGRAPVVKVLDFGLSKAPKGMVSAGSITAAHATFGTPRYMSPEQVRSTKDVDARTDQHALAIILFELLTGKAPFEAANAVELMVKISVHPAPPARSLRDTVPAGLDRAVARALAKDPAARFPTLREFAHAIAPFGGPNAKSWATNIEAIFGPTTRRGRGGDADAAASEAPTLPRSARSPRAAGLSPSLSKARQSRRARRARRRAMNLKIAALVGALAFGIVLALLSWRFPS